MYNIDIYYTYPSTDINICKSISDKKSNTIENSMLLKVYLKYMYSLYLIAQIVILLILLVIVCYHEFMYSKHISARAIAVIIAILSVIVFLFL